MRRNFGNTVKTALKRAKKRGIVSPQNANPNREERVLPFNSRWIFVMLKAVHKRRNSSLTCVNPLRWKRRKPRFCLRCPKTGSTVKARRRIAFLAVSVSILARIRDCAGSALLNSTVRRLARVHCDETGHHIDDCPYCWLCECGRYHADGDSCDCEEAKNESAT